MRRTVRVYDVLRGRSTGGGRSDSVSDPLAPSRTFGTVMPGPAVVFGDRSRSRGRPAAPPLSAPVGGGETSTPVSSMPGLPLIAEFVATAAPLAIVPSVGPAGPA